MNLCISNLALTSAMLAAARSCCEALLTIDWLCHTCRLPWRFRRPAPLQAPAPLSAHRCDIIACEIRTGPATCNVLCVRTLINCHDQRPMDCSTWLSLHRFLRPIT